MSGQTHDSEALREDERAILLDPCVCGHTLNDHGSLAGCWTCLDDGGDCDVSCEALIAERVARIVAERMTDRSNPPAETEAEGDGDE